MKKNAIMIIAGSDSIAGAGVQRDIKTCSEIRVLATNVITCVTAQNSFGVQGIEDISLEMVKKQINSIQEEYEISYMKTGMLHKNEIIEIVDDFMAKNEKIRLILDPVMVATSGVKLLQDDAIENIKKFADKAFVITPNIPEAEILTEIKIKTEDDIHLACEKIYKLGVKNVIIKGGHFDIENDVIANTLFDGSDFYKFESKRIKGREFHGTGCMFASALCSYLFKDNDLRLSMQMALDFVENSVNKWNNDNLN